jgi:hypothetical protein
MGRPYNIETSDYGFTGVTVHKIDDTFDSKEHGCCRTMCGIHYACGTITYDPVTCPECSVKMVLVDMGTDSSREDSNSIV